jgi:hypothetical protein
MVTVWDSNMVWVEERSFVFDCIARVLRSSIITEDDPLAMLAMALLFHNLGESEACNTALSRIEDALHTLPDIQDSGLQLRDSLIAGGYYYVARKAQRDTLTVNHIALKRVNFAAVNEWFQDSRLAAIIALISEEVQVGSEAKRYLRDGVDAWLDKDYVPGVLHYSLVEDEQDDQLCNYLSERDWSGDDITILTWGLLALGKLRKRGHEVYRVQYAVVRRMLGILGNSGLVQAVMAGNPYSASLSVDPLTSFDYIFAAYALNAEGFDGVVGVRRNQREALNSLLDLQRTLAQGGTVVSKGWLRVFQLSIIGFLLLLSWEILRLTGIATLLAIGLEIILGALLSAIGIWISKKGLPSTGAVRAIFGGTVLQDEAGERDS